MLRSSCSAASFREVRLDAAIYKLIIDSIKKARLHSHTYWIHLYMRVSAIKQTGTRYISLFQTLQSWCPNHKRLTTTKEQIILNSNRSLEALMSYFQWRSLEIRCYKLLFSNKFVSLPRK